MATRSGAVSITLRHFKGRVALWSFDIPPKDYDSNHHMRIKNGLYEMLITAKGTLERYPFYSENARRLYEIFHLHEIFNQYLCAFFEAQMAQLQPEA